MKAYLQSNTMPGYGRRIYIPYRYANALVVKAMDRFSCWGGSDKDTGLCLAWELGTFTDNTNFLITKIWLGCNGFTLEECSEANQCQVWK
jgi:hypothetical protein